MKIKKRLIFLVVFQFVFFFLSANILYDENVPEELIAEISILYRENNLKARFLIELHGESELLIISQDGHVRKLPLDKITARDVFNVMETMIDRIPSEKPHVSETELYDEKEFSEVESLYKKEKRTEHDRGRPFLTEGLRINDHTEFFPWSHSGSRFSAGLFISTEERWAGGFCFSAGLAFLKLGFKFKKGSNIIFDNGESVPWESYGLFLLVDIFRFYGFFFSTGFKMELYDTRGRLFEREFITLSLSQRIEWFELSVAFNISPSIVELGLFGQKYKMEQWNFIIFAGFLF